VAGAGVTMRMSRAGGCLENAPMESVWATLKSELTQRQRYATRAAAQLNLF
jgi:transposase InsO family protein